MKRLAGFDLRRRQVMAIVNVTPDSFYGASRTTTAAALEARIREAVAEGAAILDVGGCSTRPGAAEVPLEEEWRRVAAGVAAARRIAPETAVSVDTFRSEVVRRTVEEFGAVIVNDISAGGLDPAMAATAAHYDLPYIAMHMKGSPQTMQSLTESYASADVAGEVAEWLARRTAELEAAGIRRERIAVDPGFGFAKDTAQNFALLAGLSKICRTGYPVLAGLSRKSMIWRTLGTSPDEALAGTVALGWEALRQGAAILRVHDVREAVETVRLFGAMTAAAGAAGL